MISTLSDLATRLGLSPEMQTLAAQTTDGGLVAHVRRDIVERFGEMTGVGVHEGRFERAGEAFERVSKQKMHAKAKRHAK